MVKTIILLSLLAFVSVAFAERQPFDRYQSIVDRQMFGPLPPGFDPTKMPSEVSKAEQKQLTQEQQKLQSSIHFSVINVTPEGATAVGFTDNSDPKAPVHYYLKVGEQRNGWEVKEADAAAATMTIAKGDIEVSLKIGGNSAKDAGATTKAGVPNAALPQQSSAAVPRGGGLLGGSSLRSRRLLREKMEQEEKAKAEKEAAAREAERQARAEEEKAQRDAERAEMNQRIKDLTDEIKRNRETKAAAVEAADKQEGASSSEDGQNDAN